VLVELALTSGITSRPFDTNLEVEFAHDWVSPSGIVYVPPRKDSGEIGICSGGGSILISYSDPRPVTENWSAGKLRSERLSDSAAFCVLEREKGFRLTVESHSKASSLRLDSRFASFE
jgi:hypothetical protein